MNSSERIAKFYDKKFYSGQSQRSLGSAQQVVPLVLDLVHPKSVVDVGCGVGTWASAFRSQGVKDVLGIDGAYIERESLLIPQDSFVAKDLSQGFDLPRRFDLVVSLEVAEHLPASSASTFVDSLIALSDVVLFSAAVPWQGGTSHINEQWPEYWRDIFEERSYILVDALRDKIWNNLEVDPWYCQNSFIYVKADSLSSYPALQQLSEANRGRFLAAVHPGIWQDTNALPPRVRTAAWNVMRALKRSANRRFGRKSI